MILEYEIMKYDGDIGRPNLFVPLSKDLCQDKIDNLLEMFPSQTKRRWFNEEAFWSLLRLRGLECNAPSRLAEAFFVRKILACTAMVKEGVWQGCKDEYAFTSS
jgi:hypothetical protein